MPRIFGPIGITRKGRLYFSFGSLLRGAFRPPRKARPYRRRCAALTKSGSPCRNYASVGAFCRLHAVGPRVTAPVSVRDPYPQRNLLPQHTAIGAFCLRHASQPREWRTDGQRHLLYDMVLPECGHHLQLWPRAWREGGKLRQAYTLKSPTDDCPTCLSTLKTATAEVEAVLTGRVPHQARGAPRGRAPAAGRPVPGTRRGSPAGSSPDEGPSSPSVAS